MVFQFVILKTNIKMRIMRREDWIESKIQIIIELSITNENCCSVMYYCLCVFDRFYINITIYI